MSTASREQTRTGSGSVDQAVGMTRSRRLASDPLLATAVVLLILAIAFAAWSGWYWLSAPRPPAQAATRDQVLRSGEQAVLNFNTLDYRHVSQGLRLWEQSSTGALRHEISAGQTTFAQQILNAKTVTTARILDAALTRLDLRAGTARIIVAIQITVTPDRGKAVVKQSRLIGQLVHTATGWKLSALTEAPVGAAAPSTTPAG
jgi:Mce-associated membrane protein